MEKCKINYGLTSKILCVVITALNGLTVYSLRMQAHSAASYGIRAHFLSTTIKSHARRHAGRTVKQVGRPDPQFDIAIRVGRFVAGRNAHGCFERASDASERPDRTRYASVCLHFLPTASPFVRLATVVGCARRICPCADIKYTRSRSV